MKLYMLRHAPARSRDQWMGPDSERPLSDDGIVVAHDVAESISRLRLGLSAIVTSPFERALRTAAIVCDVLGEERMLTEDSRLEPGLFSKESLKEALAAHASAQAVMVVGHEPSMTEVLEDLLGGGTYSLKKGGLVRVDTDSEDLSRAVLRWFVPPRLLRRES